MDRYLAVVRVSKSQWEPGKLFCLSCCVLIWGMAAGISSPMIAIYEYSKIYIVPLPTEEDETTTYYGYICASHKVLLEICVAWNLVQMGKNTKFFWQNRRSCYCMLCFCQKILNLLIIWAFNPRSLPECSCVKQFDYKLTVTFHTYRFLLLPFSGSKLIIIFDYIHIHFRASRDDILVDEYCRRKTNLD